ncbi:MAG: type I polyketide synthase, partial [Pseudomonadota bacterium]
DPIEAEAIGRILATRRSEPLLIGSSKTNFGHLEPASGLVGVLKAQVSLANDCLPASLHFETPNPDIRFDALNLRVAAEATPLPRGNGPRAAGVNSFGFGGANAHVIVEDGEAAVSAPLTHKNAPLVVSAASEAALKALAASSADALEASGDAARFANAAAHGRQRHLHRAVIAGGSLTETLNALRAVAAGKPHDAAVVGEALSAAEKPVFVYSGNGSQWAGMGRSAYQIETDFRLAFDRTDRAFMSVAGWSLVTMLFSEDLETEIERTEIAQPLLFALQVALTEALRRAGLTPAAVVGHSVGEVAAAWASGALGLADAVRVIHARSTHQEVTRHLGGMAALVLPPDEAVKAIAPFPGLELAAVNSSRSVTISGPVGALNDFAAAARKKRWAVKRLGLDYPFHCALVDPIRAPLLASLETIEPQTPETPMVSTVTGEQVDDAALGPDYWWDNVRQPVRFYDAVGKLLGDHRLFVEIGPRPVLTGYMNDAARTAEVKATVLPSLTQDEKAEPVGAVLRRALAHGASVDDGVLFGEKAVPASVLPHYPWQHAYYRTAESGERLRLLSLRDHVLLGDRVRGDEAVWHVTHDARRLPFLTDHKVEEAVVFPAAGFTEMLLAAGRHLHPGQPVELRGLDIYAPLVLDEESEREVRTREIAPATFVIESRARLSDDPFMPHVKATVARAPSSPADVDAVHAPGDAPSIPAARLYEITGRFGLPYGPVFRRANHVALIGEDRAQVRLLPPDPATARLGFALDPTLFDSCFHALFAFIDAHQGDGATAVLPIRVGRLVLAPDAAPPASADIVVRMPGEGVVEADFVLRDEAGTTVAQVSAVRFQAVPLNRAGATPTIFAAPYVKRIQRANEEANAPLIVLEEREGLEPSETALLMEAGVQAAAAAVLSPHLSEPLSLEELVGSGVVARSAAPLVMRLLLALEASGVAREDDGRWQIEEEGLALDDVVGLIAAEHPERGAEAAILAALPAFFSGAMSEGLTDETPVASPLAQQLLTDAPFAAPLYETLLDAVTSLVRADGSLAMCVAILGAGNHGFLRTLGDAIDPARIRLIISDWDDATLERFRLGASLPPGVATGALDTLGADGHPFDAIVLAPTLGSVDLERVAKLLKPNGVVVGTAFAPSLFADAFGGLVGDWWAASAEAETPVGRLLSREEWAERLGGEGFGDIAVAPIASPDADAVIWRARLAATVPSAEPVALPALHAHGDLARKVCVALSAMPDEQPPVSDLTAIPEADCVVAVDETDPARLPETLGALGKFLGALGPEPREVTLLTFGAHGEG